MSKTKNNLKKNSQKLRKEMTKEERHLWYDFLKTLPVTIHRQKVIGPYIVDFYCASAKLVIEIDGTQHFEEKGLASDAERDKYLNDMDLTVLRYSNYDVNSNFDGVCEDILKRIEVSGI
ncbi:MAG: endonuclease domain-containing protein [Clostridia bacterium]|nr:endonuclease domain-containing protein [Clostridia bacterium]